MRHSLDYLLMWVSIIVNETVITITMMEEVAKLTNIAHQLIFTNPLIRAASLKLVKKTPKTRTS